MHSRWRPFSVRFSIFPFFFVAAVRFFTTAMFLSILVFFFKYCVVCWHLVRYRSLPQQPHQMHIATANETKVFFPWFCVCFVCSGGLEFNWTAAFVCEHTEHSQYTSFFICLFVECVGWWFLIAPHSKFPRVSTNSTLFLFCLVFRLVEIALFGDRNTQLFLGGSSNVHSRMWCEYVFFSLLALNLLWYRIFLLFSHFGPQRNGIFGAH